LKPFVIGVVLICLLFGAVVAQAYNSYQIVRLVVEHDPVASKIKQSFYEYNPRLSDKEVIYRTMIMYVTARKYGINPLLALSLASVESSLHQDAVSEDGAVGTYQLMPIVQNMYGVDATKYDENVEGGIRFLADLIDRYNNLTLALAHYNGGSNPARKLEVNTETINHVNKTLSVFRQHIGAYSENMTKYALN